VTEAPAVFVVRVDQEDAQVRARLQDFLQDDGDTARLADAGRAEDGEVAADHLVDVDMDGDVLVLLQRADLRAVAGRAAVDDAQLALAEHGGGVADGRIVGDAAREAAGDHLADEIEAGDLAELGAAGGGAHGLLGDLGDETDDQRLRRRDAHELADGRRVGGAHMAGGELDGRARAGDGGDTSRGLGRRSRGGGNRRRVHAWSVGRAYGPVR